MGLAYDPGPSASRTARRCIRRVAGRTTEARLTHNSVRCTPKRSRTRASSFPSRSLAQPDRTYALAAIRARRSPITCLLNASASTPGTPCAINAAAAAASVNLNNGPDDLMAGSQPSSR